MESKINATWNELMKMEGGTILDDWFDGGVRCIVMRGPISVNAYLGVPEQHPLSGIDYRLVPLRCHYGLTFSGIGNGKYLPSDFYWFGWDFAHSGDATLSTFFPPNPSETQWTGEMVKQELEDALWDFKTIVKMAEIIKSKP